MGDMRRRSVRDDLLRDLLIFQRMRPLVSSGLIRFGVPYALFCPNCDNGMDTRFADFVELTVDDWLRDAVVAYDDEKVSVDLTRVWGEESGVWHRRTRVTTDAEREKVIRELLRTIVTRYLSSRFVNCRSAMHRGSLIISAESVDALTIQRLVTGVAQSRPPKDLSVLASLDLPWISELSVTEALSLRGAAATALPRLRERLVLRLLHGQNDTAAREMVVQELRSEAEEVRSELAALGARNQRFMDGLVAGLALTVSVGGFATGLAPAGIALAGLLGALGTLHSSASRRDAAEASLRAKPAYALLRARDLLEHRHPG